jgi:DNA (cytosine-5)-methyltransferase 1
MRFVDLFAGIGGFSLGLERAGMVCVGQVEIDGFCNKVLEKHWPNVKRRCDIREVAGDEFGTIELICGGVPCQPASYAGRRRGVQDDRWLWPEAFRILRNVKPTWCLFENVRGLTSLEQGMVFDSLLTELEIIGYEVQTFIIPACGVDAPHRRDRVWIIGRAVSNADPAGQPNRSEQYRGTSASVEAGIVGAGGCGIVSCDTTAGCWQWPAEPPVCRVVDGVPNRVDRLKALGNAVVPQVVTEIGRAIMQAEGAFVNMEAVNIAPNSRYDGASHMALPSITFLDPA